ncbi:MAG: hypothetical protein WDW38_001486 [Sanguina aurantia]
MVLYTWRGQRDSHAVVAAKQQNDFGCWQPLSYQWVLTAEDRRRPGHGGGQAPPILHVIQHGGTEGALRQRPGGRKRGKVRSSKSKVPKVPKLPGVRQSYAESTTSTPAMSHQRQQQQQQQQLQQQQQQQQRQSTSSALPGLVQRSRQAQVMAEWKAAPTHMSLQMPQQANRYGVPVSGARVEQLLCMPLQGVALPNLMKRFGNQLADSTALMMRLHSVSGSVGGY